MSSQVLANVFRGGVVESIHRGHLIALDGTGNTVLSAGDPATITYFRSACKAFQAMPFVAGGAADALGCSDEEIALACASHSGEPRHVRIAKLMLERAGLTEAHLRCGTHLPFSEKESERMQRAGEYPTQLHNNCSGKHAAMLAYAKHIGADLATYESSDSPAQQEILRLVGEFTELPMDHVAVGVDGCAAPNFAVPVSAMAKSFMNLMVPPERLPANVREACGRMVDAMMRFPELIGGSDRLDTMLMQAAPGKLISKVGADGVWLSGVLPCASYPSGLAIALKVEDGDDRRGRPVIAVTLLKQLGIIPRHALPELSPMPIRNRRGDEVGRVEAVLPSV